MPICSSGVSQPKPGVPAAVVVDNAYIQSLLPAGLAWLYPYLPYMHGLAIGNVGAFCAADPPTWTVPSAGDIFSFVTGGPIGQVQAVTQFLQDITQAYLWYNLCECASVATPAAPSAPAAPSNLPAINPPGVVGSQPGPCGTATGHALIPAGVPSYEIFRNAPCGFGANPSCNTLGVAIPAAAKRLQLTIAITAVGATDAGGATGWVIVDASNTTLTGAAWTTPVSGDHTSFPWVFDTGVVTIPAGGVRLVATNPGSVSTGNNDVNASVTFYCDTGVVYNPGGGSSCCTATDPLTQGTLTSILQLITLIQRQLAPFAYITSTVHAGLTGSGSVAVSGILGLLANISAPSSTGLIAGTPDVLIPMGRVNLATADGYVDRHQLVVESQLILPAAAGLFTSVGYSLEPGVTMTLTELVREP